MVKEKEKGAEEEYIRVKLPNRNKSEMFGVAGKMVGGSRINVLCEDGKTRLGRILGRIRKRQWIQKGDLLIVKPWEFQGDKCDILSRYTRTEVYNLNRRGLLPKEFKSLGK
jgi:translation initiation factor 1A